MHPAPRIRVCGLLHEPGKGLLMVEHQNIPNSPIFFAPPGGGQEFGESAPEALRREFLEETGLQIEVGRLCFVYEHRAAPLHAVELFFEVKQKGGSLQTGNDPERHIQIIKEVRFMSFSEVLNLFPHTRHGIFQHAKSIEELLGLQGYFSEKVTR